VNARHIIQEIRELGKTKEGTWKHAICWNLHVEFNSLRWAAKPEKGIMDTETMAQVGKRKI
jgi:hypothetical protein